MFELGRRGCDMGEALERRAGMSRVKIVSLLLGLFVVMPIWFYLLYKILAAVSASELMWFLFWVYLPAGIFVRILTEIGEEKK